MSPHSIVGAAQRWFALPALMFLVWAASVSAQVVASFPLEGHYRAGKYMPVRVVGVNSGGAVTFGGHGILSTEMRANGEVNAITPVLILNDSATALKLGGHEVEQPLRALEENERLVGLAGVESSDWGDLFPEKSIIPIHLDMNGRLVEPAAAWEALDGLELSPAAMARLNDAQIGALLAGGTTLRVRSAGAPDQRWPWEKSGDGWMLRPQIIGPHGVVEPDGYSPTYVWERGWPGWMRRSIVGIGAIFAILAAAVLLWKSHRRLAMFVALCTAGAAGFALWYDRQNPVLDKSSAVVVQHRTLEQLDVWTWQSPLRPAEIHYPFVPGARPIFATLRQAESQNVQLHCTGDGTPQAFTYRLTPGQSQAMLIRVIRPKVRLGNLNSSDSAVDQLASDLYLRPGDRILGQTDLGEENPHNPLAALVIQAGSD